MIKCSICSYQCDNWYVSNWRLACHMNVSLGSCCPELAQALSSVALAWHRARGSTPFGVTEVRGVGSRVPGLPGPCVRGIPLRVCSFARVLLFLCSGVRGLCFLHCGSWVPRRLRARDSPACVFLRAGSSVLVFWRAWSLLLALRFCYAWAHELGSSYIFAR